MIKHGAVHAGILALAMIGLPAVTQAQDEQETTKLQASLTEGTRVRVVSGTAIDPTKAGYYRVVVSTYGFSKKGLCWTSKEDRKKITEAADQIWSYAVKRKMDWGAGVHLVFNGTTPNFDAENFNPNLWAKLFSVEIDGAAPKDCQVKAIDFGTYESPLVAIDTTATPAETYIQFSTWYNDKTDRQRIAELYRGGTALLSLVGMPIGAFQSVETVAIDEIQNKTDKKRTSKYRTQLSPFNADKVETVGYIGLREPSGADSATDPRVSVKLVPVASIFDATKTNFDQIDLSSAAAARILKLPVPVSDGTTTYLDFEIEKKTTLLGSMLTDRNDAGASSLCESLSLILMNQLKFSSTDASIVLYGAAKKRLESGITKNLRDIPCIVHREKALGRVNIVLPPVGIIEKPPIPISQEAMKDRMNTLAQFRTGNATEMPEANWSIFAFPLALYDLTDKLGLNDQQATYAAEKRADLKALFDAKLTNMGCWAYFEGENFQFSPGLGGPDPAKAVRKSAALARLSDGEVVILQLRYNGNPDGQKIDGIAFTKSDKAARDLMLKNESCNAGVVGKEWMQNYFRP